MLKCSFVEAASRFPYIYAGVFPHILQILAIPPVYLAACLRITFEADVLIDDAAFPSILLVFRWLVARDALGPPTVATFPGVGV